MEKHALYHMTWKEIEEVFKNDPVVIIPMGSTEQQGIHSLTGDYLAAEAIAKRVAEKAGAYYVPVIPFGCSEYFRCFPGTISLRPSTVEAIEDVARKLRREKGIVCFSIDLWQGLTPEAKKEIYGEGPDSSGHGGDPLTSVMLYLYPEDMRMDLLNPVENIKEYKGVPVNGLKKGMVKGVPFNLGNPFASSAERGEKIVNHLVDACCEMVKIIKENDTHI